MAYEQKSDSTGTAVGQGGSSLHFGTDGAMILALASGKDLQFQDSSANVLNRIDENTRNIRVAKVALAALDTAGACFSWQNPEGVAIIIDRIELDVTTVATSAGTVSAGTTATSATTSSANLIDTLDVNAATGVFDNITDKGTLGKSRQKLAAGKWVTGSKASGALAGLVGYAYIHYHLV